MSAIVAGYDGTKGRYNVAVGTETVSLKPGSMTQQVSREWTLAAITITIITRPPRQPPPNPPHTHTSPYPSLSA